MAKDGWLVAMPISVTVAENVTVAEKMTQRRAALPEDAMFARERATSQRRLLHEHHLGLYRGRFGH